MANTRKNFTSTLISGFTAAALLFAMGSTSGVLAAQSKTNWQVKPAAQAKIVISDEVLHQNDPRKLFGFNINYRQFQQQLWGQDQQPKAGVLDAMKPFSGAIYRYPGGSVANAFHWREAIGSVEIRPKQASFYDKSMKSVRFGVDEYFDFVSALNGMPWYVLNLVGLDTAAPMAEAEQAAMAQSNLALVKYLLQKLTPDQEPLHLQLGNELDRSRYRWPAQKYAARAQAIVELMHQELGADQIDQIKFVSFLRDFVWRGTANAKSPENQPSAFMQAVTSQLGERVPSYSLHHYYDGNRIDGRSRSIPFWIQLLDRSIADYQTQTNQSARVWITEHGRQPKSRQPGKDDTRASTSNVAAALSTADYLIALSQFSQVQGAVWHGLNAGPWQLFDYSVRHKDLRPRPIYWGLRVLRMMTLADTLKTTTFSPNQSDYSGGYDIRAMASRDPEKNKLGVRVVNRAAVAQRVSLSYAPFSSQTLEFKHFSISLREKADPELETDALQVNLKPEFSQVQFDAEGALTLYLPPSSVSTLAFERAP